jgi:phage protein D/phage baseplate assembly protein gpV
LSQAEYITQFLIKIGGSDVSKAFMADLIEVVVDTTLHMPGMFTIELRDAELEWVDDAQLDLGKEVQISVQVGGDLGGESGALFKGEITALEPHFSGEGKNRMVVRGYDKSHRLHRGKNTKTWLSKKDSDLAREIAGNAGLSSDVDATTVTYDYIIQHNESDMEFLLARAERIGYQVLVEDGKLYFKKAEWTQGSAVELVLGDTLLSFEPRWSGTHQVDKMIVRSWDPKEKKAIESTATPASALSQGGMPKTGGDMAKASFGTATEIITAIPTYTVDEAKAVVDGLGKDISREFVEAEGRGMGDPRLKAGGKVKITNIGDRFKGEYFVTSATHTYAAGVYETRFSISGRKPSTLSHLLDSGNGAQGGRAQAAVYGVVPAIVTNLEDPEDLGRVKVKYPWLDETQESFWVRPAAPMAGAERGIMYLPEVDDEVLVAFEHGDMHRPYMLGALWSSTDKPPLPNSEAFSDGKVVKRVIKTRSGHVIELDDTDGAEKIIIRDKTESNELVIDSAENSMTIKVEGDFTVEAKGKITLQSTKDMALESKAKFDVTSTQDASIKAQAKFAAEGTGGSTVKGATLTLESQAKSELKGAMVSVSGSGITEIKGSLVKIN